MTDIENDIKATEAAIERLHQDLSYRRAHLNRLYQLRSQREFGIATGMRVRSRDGEFIVDEIRPESYVGSKPWLYGRKIKSDGTPGIMRRNIFGDWEIIKDR